MFRQPAMKRGFTLIEILVTISIIALLTMIGLTNFKVANQKARDGRRQGDLEQIKAALELYRTDEGEYPGSIAPGSKIESATAVYMNEVPDDPASAQNYSYSSDTVTYTLCAALELETDTVSGCGDCGVTCNYKITSPW